MVQHDDDSRKKVSLHLFGYLENLNLNIETVSANLFKGTREEYIYDDLDDLTIELDKDVWVLYHTTARKIIAYYTVHFDHMPLGKSLINQIVQKMKFKDEVNAITQEYGEKTREWRNEISNALFRTDNMFEEMIPDEDGVKMSVYVEVRYIVGNMKSIGITSSTIDRILFIHACHFYGSARASEEAGMASYIFFVIANADELLSLKSLKAEKLYTSIRISSEDNIIGLSFISRRFAAIGTRAIKSVLNITGKEYIPDEPVLYHSDKNEVKHVLKVFGNQLGVSVTPFDARVHRMKNVVPMYFGKHRTHVISTFLEDGKDLKPMPLLIVGQFGGSVISDHYIKNKIPEHDEFKNLGIDERRYKKLTPEERHYYIYGKNDVRSNGGENRLMIGDVESSSNHTLFVSFLWNPNGIESLKNLDENDDSVLDILVFAFTYLTVKYGHMKNIVVVDFMKGHDYSVDRWLPKLDERLKFLGYADPDNITVNLHGVEFAFIVPALMRKAGNITLNAITKTISLEKRSTKNRSVKCRTKGTPGYRTHSIHGQRIVECGYRRLSRHAHGNAFYKNYHRIVKTLTDDGGDSDISIGTY